MSHMDPVSGTDIDLFIEGIIPDSLHLRGREERGKRGHVQRRFRKNGKRRRAAAPRVATALPVDELEYLLLLELLVKRRGCCQLLLFLQALLVQVTLKQRSCRHQNVVCVLSGSVFSKIDFKKEQVICIYSMFSISISVIA